MQKKLLTQIRNEWRSNLWLALELLVVSVVMWYITDLLYCRVATYLEPRGFDTSHCYLLTMRELTDDSPDYRPYASYEEVKADILELVERLRRRPGVEAVSLSQNSYPYNGSNGSDRISYDTLVSPDAIRRLVTPDFMRVFRYQGARGETPEQLAEVLERGEFLASENLFLNKHFDINRLAGKDGFHLFGDTTMSFRLGAVLQDVRYCDYEEGRFCRSFAYNLERLGAGYINTDNELCLRVTPQEDHDFMARLKADSEGQLRVGNIYLSDVRSFADIRRSYQQGYSNQLRNYLVGMGFLMLNIFLGLLGTFWFRTQQRRGEIALHKVHGATSRAVFSRLVGEGMLLLLIVTPLALLVDYVLASAELNAWRGGTTLEAGRLLACAAASFVLIALMITVGICIPARKAMRVQPAEALHDE